MVPKVGHEAHAEKHTTASGGSTALGVRSMTIPMHHKGNASGTHGYAAASFSSTKNTKIEN